MPKHPSTGPDTTHLTGVTALVAGGTGRVGRYITAELLRAGATVVVPSRSRDKIEALRASIAPDVRERFIALGGSVSDERDAARLRDEAIDRSSGLDAVVASLGGFVSAPSLVEATRDELQQVLDDYLLAHFVVARTFLPALEERAGSYAFINGPSAFNVWAGSGLVSTATAAQAMLARAFMDELEDDAVRVNELILHVGIGWGTPEETDANGSLVGRYVARLVSRDTDVRGQRLRVESPDQIEELV